MTVEIQEKTFDTGKVTLNYAEISSSQAPLVLLHGGSARWQAFNSILPGLASSLHIYAPDFRGHGKSGWRANTYRLQDYTDDVVAFLQQRLTEPAFLFGHSLGGIIALLVAAQFHPVFGPLQSGMLRYRVKPGTTNSIGAETG